MNRRELISEVAGSLDIPTKDVDAVLKALVDTIKEAVVNGNEISFVGFGTFKSAKRKARTCTNPFTGEKIEVAAKNVPVFKASKKFKERVNA